MDCGPAALKALLEGHGIHASYGRLREACQTGVDGSSIDSLETAAQQLGLDAEQIMLPADHLLHPAARALPALILVRHPNGLTHFVAVWSRHGRWLQVMDPATGRRWSPVSRFLDDLYLHTQAVPRDGWLEWASTDAFRQPLHDRLRALGCRPLESEPARLDAAVRMVQELVSSGAVDRGPAAARLIEKLANTDDPIPLEYWSAAPHPEDPSVVLMRGAVLLRISGTRPAQVSVPELAAALEEAPARPLHDLWERIPRPLALAACAGVLLAAAGVTVEARLLYGLLQSGKAAPVLAIAALLLLLEFGLATGLLSIARRLELRLRRDFLEKIPRLADRYFQSRPVSDMGERSHNVHLLRSAPELAARFARPLAEMLFTVAAIAWLSPAAGAVAAVLALAAAAIPLAAQPLLAERDLRLRSHAGALMRFNLDALLGLTAIRSHRAAPAIQHEQETLLAEWARAGLSLQRAVVCADGLALAAGFAIAILAVRVLPEAGFLLAVYWILNLPALGQDAAAAAYQYPMLRNTALRLMEPLGAPESPRGAAAPGFDAIAISMRGVCVEASGHVILEDLTLDIAAGEHVAIVGPSGAGKSSLAGLLLGWHQPSTGELLVNGASLDASALDALRRSTAWVDPQVQLWNRPLDANLRFGSPHTNVDEVIAAAGLGRIAARLTGPLGEGGALVSGGEGQRVRLARALGRADAKLVILDEPGRGLDRAQRRELIALARARWPRATLLCITHDIGDTLDFARVLVVENSRIAEDGAPPALAADPQSRYRSMLDAANAVRQGLWEDGRWRRVRLQDGRLVEGDAAHA